MNLPSRIASLLACSAILAAFPAGVAQAAETGTFERSFDVDGPIILDVTTGSGQIVVRTGNAGRAEITGRITVRPRGFLGLSMRSDEKVQEIIARFESEPPVEFAGGRLLVGHASDWKRISNVSIDYEITVPGTTEVKSSTGSGSQTISGVAGPVEADAGSGSITLRDIGGAVSADAGSGSITLEDIGGPAKADTGSGSIRAERIAGSFEADAGSGSIFLSQSAPGDVVVSSGSGGIELQNVAGALHADTGSGRIVVSGRQEGPWDLDASSGSIRIDLPDDAAFDLDAESSSGSINVDHPVTVRGEVSKKHLRGTVRGGGELLRVETSSGSIRIE